MFNDNTTRRLMAIEDEQKAQKVAAPLNYGQLAKRNLPTATWSGFISQYIPPDKTVIAEWEVVFQRTDGIKKPPLVQLSYNHEQNPHQTPGAVGRDPNADEEYGWWLHTKEVGDDYVKFTILIDPSAWFIPNHDGANCDLTVQAISPVAGALSIRRLQ
jgi:hypothetical protein